MYVFTVPGTAPYSLMVLTVQTTYVTLSWMSPVIPNGIITQYEIQYRRSNDSLFNISNISSTIMGDTLMGRVEGLTPITMYVFQLRAYTQVGAGPYSDNLTIETLPERKSHYL